MSLDCAGRHQCDPPQPPATVGLGWTCDECGRLYRSVNMREHIQSEPIRARIPEGTLGWTSSPATP